MAAAAMAVTALQAVPETAPATGQGSQQPPPALTEQEISEFLERHVAAGSPGDDLLRVITRLPGPCPEHSWGMWSVRTAFSRGFGLALSEQDVLHICQSYRKRKQL